MTVDNSFALCLTHDLDRPYKTYQALFYAVQNRKPAHLKDILPGRNPYWQFENIMTLEDDLGVRSAFYILNEPHLIKKGFRSWFRPIDWVQQLGRYDVTDPLIVRTVHELRAGGWEVGLHGSYRSFNDIERLRYEKQILEECLEGPVIGGRQHYLNLSIPETWHLHSEIGLRYDTSLGSGTTYGFQYGYTPIQPFDDEFVVFPLTLMEQALPDPGDNFDAAWDVCLDLLDEAAANNAVMTVLWHPRFFSESNFPGYRSLYRRLIEQALEMDAWVGSPAECYYKLDIGSDCSDCNSVKYELTKA